jgi:hypothetical protein
VDTISFNTLECELLLDNRLVHLPDPSQLAFLFFQFTMQETRGSTEVESQNQENVVEQTVEHIGPMSSQGFNLEVVLPFHLPPLPQALSGVNLLLSEDSLSRM